MEFQVSLTEESLKKGYAFERWVVDQFSEQWFLLHEWRSDKCSGKRKPRSNRNPDLVIQLSNSRAKLFFAVECKWRARSNDGRYPWAATYKRIVYNNYGEKLKIPIYIALGIGGSPDNPENAYLIPFGKIQYEDFIRQPILDKYRWPANPESLKSYIKS